jgi:NAD(P)-dependent dehydrogenase (short-subunit alcohol dehydrogenase family)
MTVTDPKTVVVLGSAYGGIGAAGIARRLPAGWRVVVIDRNTHANRESCCVLVSSTRLYGPHRALMASAPPLVLSTHVLLPHHLPSHPACSLTSAPFHTR